MSKASKGADPIFPEIGIVKNEKDSMVLHTSLRKKYRGKYYLWNFYKNTSQSPESVKIFVTEIYLAMILGKIQPKLKDCWGGLIFKVDKNQQTEKERMENIYCIKPKN